MREKQSKKVYGRHSHYWNDDIRPLLIASLCVELALENSDITQKLYWKTIPDLDNSTIQEKKDAYGCLDLKLKATPESIDIKGYIQPKVCTATQTSG